MRHNSQKAPNTVLFFSYSKGILHNKITQLSALFSRVGRVFSLAYFFSTLQVNPVLFKKMNLKIRKS
jgi:hypothetical protein